MSSAEGEGQQLSEKDLSLLMLLMKQNGNSLGAGQPSLGSSFSSSVSPSAASLLSSSSPSASSLLSSFGQQSQANSGSFLASRPALSFENPRGISNSAQTQDPSLQFAQHERESLIGHLVNLQSKKDSKLVLTPRQRQALEEETRLRQSSFSSPSLQNFQSSSTGRFQSQSTSRDNILSSFLSSGRNQQSFGSQQETSRNSFQRPREQNFNSILSSQAGGNSIVNVRPLSQPISQNSQGSEEPFLPNLILGNQRQQSKSVSIDPRLQPQRLNSQNIESHPSAILNKLPLSSQQKFLEQFLSLTPEHQSFVYRKLLNSPADIQQFAIDQFISLDNRVLVVSIQAELDKENQKKTVLGTRTSRINASQGFIGPTLPTSGQATFPNNQFGQTSTDLRNLNPNNLSIEELVTLQEQRQLAEQEEQLRAIIDFQRNRDGQQG